MQDFDVVIIGAGPAGGQCARTLAAAGRKILLVEQHKNFYQNNYSSAAIPMEALKRYDLPDAVVGSYWRKLAIIATDSECNWQSTHLQGAVLDFAALKAFLAGATAANGGQVWMGHRYLDHSQADAKIAVRLKPKAGDPITVGTRVLVDATGFARAVVYPEKKDKPAFLRGKGLEYLIAVEDGTYRKYADTLTFFMGHYWSPKGYSWIFPMVPNRLKVGTARLDDTHRLIQQIRPLKDYIHSIIQNHIKPERYDIIDRHGSIIEYSSGLKDIYSRDDIIAIGDAVSTINFLGGEGIRHGMTGAEIACRHIQYYLDGQSRDFRDYQSEMHRCFAGKWNLSEQISRRVYLEYSDRKISRSVSWLQYLSMTDIIDILFHYRFEAYFRYLRSYLKFKLLGFLKAFKKLMPAQANVEN
ncbi:MAG: NAD(P)/FAD-dependent oxidoreductase [Candidatus Competibacteraceae bacterium]